MYREIIDKQIANAMKNGNHLQLTVWRAIKTEFVKYQTSGAGAELTDDKEMQIITKMVQQRKDSFEQYTSAGRTELATVEENEMKFLASLLPNDPTDEDIVNSIEEFVKTKTEKLTIKDMRDVMAFVKAKYPPVNGGLVSKIFRENYI
jgi:uncharacterized protein YqeY